MHRVALSVPVAILAAFALFLAACSSSDSSSHKNVPSPAPTTTTLSAADLAAQRQARAEVTLRTCGADRQGNVTVSGMAHNTTSGTVNYEIQIVITNPAPHPARYVTIATAERVHAATTAKWTAATTAKHSAGTNCRIAQVSRQPA